MRFEPITIHRFYQKFTPGRKRDCWIWVACGQANGRYGTFVINRIAYGSHRISYMIHKGEIPEKMYVLHSCDTPRCINPHHLFLGTAKENMQDAINKGRIKRQGIHNVKAKLTEKQVLEIRKKYIPWKYSLPRLSKEYGVDPSSIWQIVKGKHWKHI